MKMISPQKLFPTVSLESISNDTIHFFMEKFRREEEVVPVQVYQFGNHYYIIDGHHRMLAANICGMKEINVIELGRNEVPNWCQQERLINMLNRLGMRTIYDFEAIGAFTYDEYPQYYMNQEK